MSRLTPQQNKQSQLKRCRTYIKKPKMLEKTTEWFKSFSSPVKSYLEKGPKNNYTYVEFLDNLLKAVRGRRNRELNIADAMIKAHKKA